MPPRRHFNALRYASDPERGHAIWKCDHCGVRQNLAFRPSKKNWKLPKLLEEMRSWVLAQRTKGRHSVTAEEIAAYFRAKMSLVRQGLHFLNLEGLVTRRDNRIPHDCRRANTWFDHGSDNSWCASTYGLNEEDKE